MTPLHSIQMLVEAFDHPEVDVISMVQILCQSEGSATNLLECVVYLHGLYIKAGDSELLNAVRWICTASGAKTVREKPKQNFFDLVVYLCLEDGCPKKKGVEVHSALLWLQKKYKRASKKAAAELGKIRNDLAKAAKRDAKAANKTKSKDSFESLRRSRGSTAGSVESLNPLNEFYATEEKV